MRDESSAVNHKKHVDKTHKTCQVRQYDKRNKVIVNPVDSKPSIMTGLCKVHSQEWTIA